MENEATKGETTSQVKVENQQAVDDDHDRLVQPIIKSYLQNARKNMERAKKLVLSQTDVQRVRVQVTHLVAAENHLLSIILGVDIKGEPDEQ